MTEAPASRAERDTERVRRVGELARLGAEAIPALLAELVEPSWAVRRAVVKALAEADSSGAKKLVEELRTARKNEAQIAGMVDALALSKQILDQDLITLLDDPNPAVVCDAAQILGRRESKQAVPALKRLTEHADDNVALAAVEALGRVGGREAIDSLLLLAETRNFFRTFPTIDVLGRSGDPRALEVLLRLAADPLYGVEAVRAIGRLGDVAALPALVELLEPANEPLALGIAQALVAIYERSEQRFGTGVAVSHALAQARNLPAIRQKLTLALKGADALEQIAACQVLSFVADEGAAHTLLGLLSGPPSVAQVAQASLRRIGGLAEPLALAALRFAPSAQRKLLVPIVSGRLSARNELVACLADDDPTVRASACDALARTSDPSSVPALSTLLGDTDARVAQAALGAIQSLGSAETERAALEAAASSDARVRVAGLRILGYFGYISGLGLLVAAARSDDERTRDAALGALPFVEDPGAQGALLEASEHASARTRAAAIRALGHTSGESPVIARLREALHDDDAWVRYYACQALGHLKDDSSTEGIARLLADPSGQVRVAAVDALAHLRGARAFEVLTSVLGSTDADLYRAALVALGISKRKEALSPLLRAVAAAEAATRLVALSALAELDAPEVVQTIARATEDRDEGVRASAASFLAARSERSATSELLRLLAKSPTRESLIFALSRPADGRVAAIEAALVSAHDALAGSLIAALSRMQAEEAKAAIRATLLSPNDAARRAAAAALVATLDAPSAAALAHAAVSDTDAEVRRICAASLALSFPALSPK